MNMLKKGVLALTTGMTLVAMAAPAEARTHYRGGYGYGYGYRHHGNGTANALAGGIVGLALGAAIASSSNRGGGYYNGGYYGRPYRDSYYRDDYYYRPRVEHYRSYRSCSTDRYWDDYRGGWTTIQRCD